LLALLAVRLPNLMLAGSLISLVTAGSIIARQIIADLGSDGFTFPCNFMFLWSIVNQTGGSGGADLLS
jgi:hypothetical protein